MRFHIGFSKRISLKTLIEIIGFIFIGLLAFLGIDKVHADTLNHFDLSNASLSSQYGYVMTNSLDNQIDVVEQPLYYRAAYFGNQSYMTLDLKNDSTGTQNILGYSYVDRVYNGAGNAMRVFKEVYYNFSNENFCDKSSYKSNDIYIDVMYDTGDYNRAFLNGNNFTLSDIWEMKFNAIDSNGDYYVTNCSYSTYRSGPNSSTSIATYYCPNTFIGNNQKTITTYSIDLFNKLSQDGGYSGSYNSWILFYTNMRIDMSDSTYECTSNDPTIDFTTAETTPSKPDIDNAMKEARENFVPNIPGINTDLFDIEYPSNIQELLSLPLYVLDNIVERSYSCTPYELDLSSLTTLGRNYTETKITFPCMRNKLASLLGTLYNLIDILMAAIVFYNIAMAIIQLIEAVTDGVDLWSFYFTGTDEGRKFRLWFWGDMK